jgi:hypothetical protein
VILYVFIALSVKDGKRNLLLTDAVVPGTVDLFAHIRDFGLQANIGRYRRLDLNIDSPTHGFHLFEHGIVKLASAHV